MWRRHINGTRLVAQIVMPYWSNHCVRMWYRRKCFHHNINYYPNRCNNSFQDIAVPNENSFAISMNKSQRPTLSVAFIHVKELCFSYGQLYVACSRVWSKYIVFVFTSSGKTEIVYKEVFFFLKIFYVHSQVCWYFSDFILEFRKLNFNCCVYIHFTEWELFYNDSRNLYLDCDIFNGFRHEFFRFQNIEIEFFLCLFGLEYLKNI